MRFHAPSFALGVASAVALKAAGRRLRPVVVELGALSLELARLSRGVIERQREGAEDLWAEIDDRVRARLQPREPEPRAPAAAEAPDAPQAANGPVGVAH